MVDPTSGPVTLAKLQNPIKQSFEAVTSDLKDVHKGQSKYQKALESVNSVTKQMSSAKEGLAIQRQA